MKRIAILMLGGAKRVSLGRMFQQAGRRLGFAVELYSYELSERQPIAEIAEIVVGKKWDSPQLAAHLKETVESRRIDIIIPFVDGAIEVACRAVNEIEGLWAPVGDIDLAKKMYDKQLADELFRSLDIPVPELRHPFSDNFPIIAKPVFGSASKGIVVIRQERDFLALNHDTRYLFQEYIADREEFTVDCYVDRRGETVMAVPRRRIEVVGGEVTRTATVRDHELVRLSDLTLSRIGLKGAVTLQFIKDKRDGRLMLMEVNPRPAGGVVCSVHAGADLPEIILRDWAAVEQPEVRWTPGIEIARYPMEVVFVNNPE